MTENQSKPENESPAGKSDSENEDVTPRSRGRVFWEDWAKPFIIILAVLSTFRSAIADWNDVPTGSMKPTIVEGDRIFVNKVAYGLRFPFTKMRLIDWSQPKRGDIVVFFSPEDGKRLVKRLVAVPNDVIEVKGGQLYVNQEPCELGDLDEEIMNQLPEEERLGTQFFSEQLGLVNHPVMFTHGSYQDNYFGPETVPEGKFVMMGDNRNNSRDSRYFKAEDGTSRPWVDRSLILGRATTVVLSLDRNNYYLPRWDRFFRPLP